MPRTALPLLAATALLALISPPVEGQSSRPGTTSSGPAATSRGARGVKPAGPVDLGGFVLTPPKEWKAVAVRPGVRKAQLVLPKVKGDAEDGELVVFYFGPQGAGSVEANLERWGRQVERPDGMKESDYRRHTTRKVAGMTITTLEMRGTYRAASFGGPAKLAKPGFRMIASVIESPRGNYFIRCTGPDKTLGHWHKAYEAMLSALKPASKPAGK